MQRYVDPREAEEVVRLAVAREAAPPAEGPTVEGLAEALSLPVSEIERLLAQVRRRAASAAPQRRFADRSATLSAGIVLALVLTVAAIGGGYRYMRRPQADVATHSSEPLLGVRNDGSLIVSGDVRFHDGQGSGPVFEAPVIDAPSVPTAPLTPSLSPSFTEEELKGNAEIVRRATESVAKMSVTQRKAQYEALTDSIQSRRVFAAEIRRKAPARRTSGEKALLQAVAAFDRLLDVSDEG